MNKHHYDVEFKRQVDLVFAKHPEANDRRDDYPWLTGYLGDPFCRIWFLALNPSLSRLESVSNRRGTLTEEAQWSESKGDKLFRKMLVKHGFKQGEIFSPGGWRCYITNLIKEPDYAKHWNVKTDDDKKGVALLWSGVLEWELANSIPRLIVIMGKETQKLLTMISKARRLALPKTHFITHYSYIGSYAQGHLPPMAPERVEEYDRQFYQVDKIFRDLRA